MTEYIVFWTLLLFTFLVTFRILQALKIEKYFKPNSLKEIYAAYILIGLIAGFLIASLGVKIIELWPGNVQFFIR